MLRHARHHFDSLRPYRWRMLKIASHVRPKFAPEARLLESAVSAMDRAAQIALTPEEYAAYLEPWMPPDHE